MFESYNTLTTNGRQYDQAGLKKLCKEKLHQPCISSWEKSLYNFIYEWIDESKPYIMATTSGSTGKPKIISIPKDKMIQSAKMTARYLELKQEENALLCLSCNYIAGKMMVVRAFVIGMNLIPVPPSKNPLTDIPQNQKIDFAAFVPMQFQEILNQNTDKINGIRNILIGGAPVSHELKAAINNFENNIYETFGMSETISHIALKLLSKGNQAAYFQTLEGIAIQQDERGCLQVDAPHLCDSTIATNDLVEIKDAHHFRWLGRYDNLINSGGIKLIPEELEEKIGHLISQRFFFAGLPDEQLGEKLTLVVEGKVSSLEFRSLELKIQKVLGKYEQPKEILFVERFKETGNGKIMRGETLEHSDYIRPRQD